MNYLIQLIANGIGAFLSLFTFSITPTPPPLPPTTALTLATPTRMEKHFIAIGTFTEKDQTVTIRIEFPEKGGDIHGNISGSCTGEISGEYSQTDNGQKLAGSADAICLGIIGTNVSFTGWVSPEVEKQVNLTAYVNTSTGQFYTKDVSLEIIN